MKIFILFLIASIGSISCGKGTKSAKLSVKMSERADASLADRNQLGVDGTSSFTAPEYMKLKIIAVELKNAAGGYIAVWVNPGCAAEKHVDKGDRNGKGKKEYYNAEGCSLSTIDSYIDIGQSIEDVNKELNSQALPVPPDTYTEVSIRMCGINDTDEDKADSILYMAGGMDQEQSATNQSCGVTGAPETSLVVAEGVTTVVNLQYDRSSLVEINTLDQPVTDESVMQDGCQYLEDGSAYYCPKFGATTFVPKLGE